MSDLRDQLFAEPLWEAIARQVKLTPAEMHTARLLCMGTGTKEIAQQRHCSPKTIETYRMHMSDKFNTCGTAELVSKLLLLVFEKYLETHRE